MKRDKKEETTNPYFYRGGLDLQNRQFFSVFRSNGGKREATVKRKSRSRGGMEKKKHEKHLCPSAHQDRETTKNILRMVNS